MKLYDRQLGGIQPDTIEIFDIVARIIDEDGRIDWFDFQGCSLEEFTADYAWAHPSKTPEECEFNSLETYVEVASRRCGLSFAYFEAGKVTENQEIIGDEWDGHWSIISDDLEMFRKINNLARSPHGSQSVD